MVEKNMKRFLVLGILGLFMISMMAGVLGAWPQAEDYFGSEALTDTTDTDNFYATGDTDAEQIGTALGEEARGFGEGVRAFFVGLFGDIKLGGGEGTTILFFAIILGMFVYTAISSFIGKEKEFITWGVTIAITVIAIIAIPDGYLTALKTSYGAMGLTILTVVPFLILLAFTLKTNNMAIARGTWLVFVIYYIWMYIAELIRISGLPSADKISSIPYWVAIIAGIAMFFFVGQFRKYLFGATLESDIELATQKNLSAAAALKLERERTKATTGV